MSKIKLFSADDFEKSIDLGDELVFDKPEFKTMKIVLQWKGTDLDLCAFMLHEDGMIRSTDDVVFNQSKLRWKTKLPFDHPDFNLLDGKFSTWPNPEFVNPHKWKDNTLPISKDGSVIGSWDDMAEDEDDNELREEQIHVMLDEINTHEYKSIVFAAVAAPLQVRGGVKFKDVKEPVVKIVNADKDVIIAEYKLNESFPTADSVCFGKLAYDERSMIWSFHPMAEGYNGGAFYLATEVFY